MSITDYSIFCIYFLRDYAIFFTREKDSARWNFFITFFWMILGEWARRLEIVLKINIKDVVKRVKKVVVFASPRSEWERERCDKVLFGLLYKKKHKRKEEDYFRLCLFPASSLCALVVSFMHLSYDFTGFRIFKSFIYTLNAFYTIDINGSSPFPLF